jgi:putative hydrolase of the HAD superfamily
MRAVLFDLDNTLILEDEATFAAVRVTCDVARERASVDTVALYDATLRAADSLWRASSTFAYAEAMGIWWGEGLWGEFVGDAPGLRALRAFAPRFRRETWHAALASLGVADTALASELAAAYRGVRRAKQLVDPEAESVLDDLARDHRLGLVTNGAPDVQREKLAGTTLGSRFATIVISAELGIAKPDPRIFEVALGVLGAAPRDAAMVGDSLPRDVAGAHQAGLRAIWIDRALAAAKADDPVPDARIRALSEVRSALAATAPGGASPRGSRGPHPA